MSGKGSRRKGADFERLIRRWFDKENYRVGDIRLLHHGHLGESEEDLVIAVDYCRATSHGGAMMYTAEVSIEAKNHSKVKLPEWWRQAVDQARRRGAHAAIVHKRHGSTDPAEQWVTMSLKEWTSLLEAVSGNDE